MLTGCGGKQAATQPTATAVPAAADTVTVPGVMGLTLDKATDQLKDLGLRVEAVDTTDGKSIIAKKNWQVTSQDPNEGAQVAKGTTVNLGVRHLTEATPTPTPTPTTAEPAPVVAAPAPYVAPAPAAVPAPYVAPAPAPAPYVAPAPAPAAFYANCTAVKAAGAAPIYAGQPGYSRSLDRDGDGVGCEK
ncbi:excalibur calcium-binding domain-containing protein [Arthrobacter sp. SO3]|uniref:excalibur calcium-binding domain-containing protein n=1 Tax=Arthrobacter sp. SO3 TaxID=1897057 RepID=UPI001CFF7C90|nr:excalibur calcium-binding domain-containing protein [Arthrobacter sp. SO3]